MSLSRSLVLALAALILGASPALAQKVARKATEVASEGFKVKGISSFDAVPIDGRGTEVLKFAGDGGEFEVHAFRNAEIEGAEEGKSVAKKRRQDIVEFLTSRYRGFSKKQAKNPAVEEIVEIDGMEAKHRRFEGIKLSDRQTYNLDVWSFPMSHADLHLVYTVNGEISKKWISAMTKSAKTFEKIERVVEEEIDNSTRTFGDQLKWAEREAEKTEGWRAIGTPSERFVILTNATKKAFIDEVIKRLEVSRNVYEQDFPPPADFKAVSVIRICKDREEFQRFSGTGGGVAGYFSPSSVELVLYDDVLTDRNSTYAVVSHEAFHQYCHFLFGQSEAHRWFDEGHGDYYGGMKITGKRGKITPKMPSGLDRLSVIREMVQQETYKPVEEHIHYNHGEWQSQGPSNVSCYAQSWSIIYMLRQGALRKVNGKCWKKEYANIIPNYVRVLNEGFQEAYDEIRDEKKKRAEKRGIELTPEDLKVNRFDLDPRRKQKIWDAAMEASWGQIDVEEFEKNWVLYVKKHLK